MIIRITVVVVVQLLSCVWFFVTSWTAAHQAFLSFTTSWSLLKLMSIESVMPSNHLILCHPLLLLFSIFPSSRVFSNESALQTRWPHVLQLQLQHQSFQSPCYCSVAQSCLTVCDLMDCSTPGFPVLHHLLKFARTHVHWVSGAIQPSHPLSSPSPPALNLSQHQGLFQWVSSLHPVAKGLEFQLQH